MIEETPSRNPSEQDPPVEGQLAPDDSPTGGPTPGNPLPGSPALARRGPAQPAAEASQSGEDDDGPFPGWYPDPLGRAAERFWNGREWTANSRGEVSPVAAAPSTVTSTPAVGTSTPDPGPRTDVPSPRPRIFGNNTDDASKTTEDDHITRAALSEPTASTHSTSTPLVPAAAASSPQGDRVKSAPAERTETGPAEPASAGHQLFSSQAATRASVAPSTPTSQTPAEASPAVEPNPTPPTAPTSPAAKADPIPSEVAAPTPAPEVAPEAPSSRSWLVVVLAALCALGLGLAIGWFGRGSNDAQDSSPVTTTAEQVEDEGNVAEDEPVVDEPDPAPVDTAALDELEAEIEVLSSDLDEARAEIDTVTAERDNEQDHNDILLTWFTPEVRDRSERNWNAEVARACAADAEPTLENTSYTRAMELMGTHADLVAAVQECQAAG